MSVVIRIVDPDSSSGIRISLNTGLLEKLYTDLDEILWEVIRPPKDHFMTSW